MWPDQVIEPGPLALESDVLLSALRGPACTNTVDPDQTAHRQCLSIHQQLLDRFLDNNYYNIKMFGIFMVFYIKYKIFI